MLLYFLALFLLQFHFFCIHYKTVDYAQTSASRPQVHYTVFVVAVNVCPRG